MEIEQEGGVKRNVIVQGHSTNLNVTRAGKPLNQAAGREAPFCILPSLFPGAQNPLESSRSFKAPVLILSFLLISFKSDLCPFPQDLCAHVRAVRRAGSTTKHNDIKSQQSVLNILQLSLLGPHKNSGKQIILSSPLFRW